MMTPLPKANRFHPLSHTVDLTGERFGKLVVLQRSERVSTSKRFWLLQCDCGKTTVVATAQLTTGHTKSCGCLQKESAAKAAPKRRLPSGRANRNLVLSSYKNGARRRNLEWSLSEDQFDLLTKQPCYYCGVEPSNRKHDEHTYGEFDYNGLDRNDCGLGYTQTNAVACCWKCNWMKRHLSEAEFLTHIEHIFNHQLTKKVTELVSA